MNPVTVRAQAWGAEARWDKERYSGREAGEKGAFEHSQCSSAVGSCRRSEETGWGGAVGGARA